MKKEETLIIKKACRDYLEEFSNEEKVDINCFDIDSLTLGIILQIPPCYVHLVYREQTEKIMADELYKQFREEVIEISKEGMFEAKVLEQEELDEIIKPGDYKLLEEVCGITANEYLKSTDILLQKWRDYIKKNNKELILKENKYDK